MDMNEREKRLRQKQAQRRKNVLIMKCIISLLILIVVFLAVVLIKDAVIPGVKKQEENTKKQQQEAQADAGGSVTADQTESTEGSGSTEDQLLAAADVMAAQYDYDGAIESAARPLLCIRTARKCRMQLTGYQQVKATVLHGISAGTDHTRLFPHNDQGSDAKAFDGDCKRSRLQSGYDNNE